MKDRVLIKMVGVTKTFPGVVANDSVDFDLGSGEVHTILGENGAGKTTLMNILSGMYQPDEGEVFVRGERVKLRSPYDSLKLGIGMVYQHFKLIPTFTVAENVVLGAEPLYANLESRFEKRVIKTEIPKGVKGQVNRFGRSSARLITGTVDRISPMNLRKAKSRIKQIAEENALFVDPNS